MLSEHSFLGLFVDLDGTLADSEPTLRECYRLFLASYGLEPDVREFEQLVGPSVREIVDDLRRRRHLPGSSAELETCYREIISEQYARSVVPRPGAQELLLAADSAGKVLLVVTSAPRDLAVGFLRRSGFMELVAEVVAGDQVTKAKPHPEIYVRALRTSRMHADDVVALEDSAAGLKAALSAGLRAILVGDRADGGLGASSPHYLGREHDLRSAWFRLVGSYP